MSMYNILSWDHSTQIQIIIHNAVEWKFKATGFTLINLKITLKSENLHHPKSGEGLTELSL